MIRINELIIMLNNILDIFGENEDFDILEDTDIILDNIILKDFIRSECPSIVAPNTEYIHKFDAHDNIVTLEDDTVCTFGEFIFKYYPDPEKIIIDLEREIFKYV